LFGQIDSALASKDEQMKQIEAKKDADIEAAELVPSFPVFNIPPLFQLSLGLLTPPSII
jgi:hypothetical protein